MNNEATTAPSFDIPEVISDLLATIDQEREKEIITRRFGLYDRKETLEQIGELLGITRERVRQLEKAIISRLKTAAAEGDIPAVKLAEKQFIRTLTERGRAARITDLADHFAQNSDQPAERQQAHIAFIGELSTNLTTVNENDNYYQSIAIADYGTEKELRARIDELVKVIRKHGKPVTIDELDNMVQYEHPSQIAAIASMSKKLAHLRGLWGLSRWPMVNPKNIRDKIYVILADAGKPLHFSDIADAIKESGFKRNNVTTQAIHNELIKDKRFVLIGRGIYALDSWGFSKGTVADIIADVLKAAEKPLHRDDIVNEVLKKRQVKETTILLNLQSKPQFKRVAKATYALEPVEAA